MDKITRLCKTGILRSIFKDKPHMNLKSVGNPKQSFNFLTFLEGFFYVFVYNDPLIRYFL